MSANPRKETPAGYKSSPHRSTYITWQRMKGRCSNPNAVDYARYGGRGIVYCERWAIFANFLADMGGRPAGTVLDRINNDGNYEPGNCRWITIRDNARNRCSNLLVTIDGQTKTATEWGEITGLGNTFRTRIKAGWEPAKAASTPKNPSYTWPRRAPQWNKKKAAA